MRRRGFISARGVRGHLGCWLNANPRRVPLRPIILILLALTAAVAVTACGEQGPKGDKGDQGVAGPPGVAGAPGRDGKDAAFANVRVVRGTCHSNPPSCAVSCEAGEDFISVTCVGGPTSFQVKDGVSLAQCRPTNGPIVALCGK